MSNQYTHALFLLNRHTAVMLAVCGAALLTACHRAPPPAAAPTPVVALPVHALGGSSSTIPMHYPVEVAARYGNAMAFRVAGQIVERTVRLGEAVHRGQVVARLDAVDAQKQEAAARAALDAAEHRLVFAEQTLNRDKAQQAQNLIAANQLEQSENEYAAALAGKVQASNQWEVARNTLRYNSLVADHDGVITSENADTGQVVSAGQAVYGLAWSGAVDVNLDAAASDLGRIATGQSAVVTFTALPEHHFNGRVREISPAADPQSRTYRIKLTLIDGSPEVRLGMTGDALLAPAHDARADAQVQTFVVPATAIFHRGKEPAVWVVKPGDSTATLRPVTVASYSERSATVSGLHDGDTVVQAGVHTVYEGEHVTPVQPLFYEDQQAATAQVGAP